MTVGQVGAFFDIDKTVIEVNSGTRWISHQWKHGDLTTYEALRAIWWTAQYHFGLLDFDAMARRVLGEWRGRDVEALADEVEAWFRDQIAPTICTEAREAIEHHRSEGHVVALLTSATRFLSIPLSQVLSVEHVLCTEIEEHEGRFTGNHIEPACYGPGKVLRAEAFAAEHGIDLERSFFYSDSYSDLPMLERVGQPRVINPDPRLRRTAQQRGWPATHWRAPRPA